MCGIACLVEGVGLIGAIGLIGLIGLISLIGLIGAMGLIRYGEVRNPRAGGLWCVGR